MRLWKYIFIILLLILSLLIIALLQLPDNKFHLIACNVGQGDATLLTYKNIQVLVDGGPDDKVLDCLGKYLPFWDREIELVVLTHPDGDHFTGLIDVFKFYKVDNYLTNNISIIKPEYRVLENTVGSSGVRVIYPVTGQSIGLDLIQLDTLAPLEQFLDISYQISDKNEISDEETNKYSIVSLVRFGNFKALLTGDMTNEVSDRLADTLVLSEVEWIKIPHHGSKNGLTQNLLEKTMPGLAIISVGKNNYGHPSNEILEMLETYGIKYLRTDKAGDVEVVTDGKTWRIK